jgi:hypothetical protein
MKFYDQKPLYLLKFQTSEWEPTRELTQEERIAGWYDTIIYDGKSTPVIANERHQAGAIRSRSASHVLSWTVSAGEEVIAVFNVDVEFDVTIDDETAARYREATGLPCEPSMGMSPVGVRIDPYLYVSKSGVHLYLVADSVLGRAVALGEDGAEDAFGHDALRIHLDAFLARDERKTLCAASFSEEQVQPLLIEVSQETAE